jgi:hypothetical protein
VRFPVCFYDIEPSIYDITSKIALLDIAFFTHDITNYATVCLEKEFAGLRVQKQYQQYKKPAPYHRVVKNSVYGA